MGNVVELFPIDAAKDTILENLKNMHHGKAVNHPCAIKGVKNFSLACSALNELVSDKLILIKRQELPDGKGRSLTVSMYQYNFR